MTKARVAVLMGGAAVVATGAGMLFTFDPATTSFFPPCPFHYLTGLHCPGCGSTRALHHLTHGRLATALAYNPLVPLLLPFLAFAVVRQGLGWSGITARSDKRLPARWIWGLLLVILLFGLLRNIPVSPLSRLAPPPNPPVAESAGPSLATA